MLEDHGFGDADILWTEWGVGSTHFGPIHDGVAGAPFVLSGMRSAQHRMSALAYWVVSDHFEELGRPPRLFHDGFGLLTLGNLRKPRYWALHLAAHLGDHVLPTEVTGDGADVLVRAWAARHDDGPDRGTVDVLVWNGTVNAELLHGDPRLVRDVRVTVGGLTGSSYAVELARIDEQHSNIRSVAGDADWPDADGWRRLREADHLHTERIDDLSPDSGTGTVTVTLPQPGVVRIRLVDGDAPSATDEEKTRMKHSTRTRSTALASVFFVASALALGACAGNDNNTGAAGGGTLTIQGDAGNPQLVENFNPLVIPTELHGAQLMYEPLEIRSPIDGHFTPYLATGHDVPEPQDGRVHDPPGRHLERRQAVHREGRRVHLRPAEEVPRARRLRHLVADHRRQGVRQQGDRHLQAAQRPVRRACSPLR